MNWGGGLVLGRAGGQRQGLLCVLKCVGLLVYFWGIAVCVGFGRLCGDRGVDTRFSPQLCKIPVQLHHAPQGHVV